MFRLGITATFALAAMLALAALVSASTGPQVRASAVGKPTEISCLDDSGRGHVRKKKPRSCSLFGPGGAFAGGVNLAQLEWKGWGKKRATAKGIEKGFHLPFSHIAVDVVAFERVACGDVFRYAKLRATSRHGTTTASAPAC